MVWYVGQILWNLPTGFYAITVVGKCSIKCLDLAMPDTRTKLFFLVDGFLIEVAPHVYISQEKNQHFLNHEIIEAGH